MHPDLIGGRYRVERAIGQGGMGTVWLCRDETLHRVVAVKQVGLLPGESVTDSARAFREARSSAGLSHRNVVTVFDVVEESGRIWLVMEHVAGRSLSEMIKQDGPLEPALVADIGAQVAAGLAALHAAGTMHRDVKPGNVLVRDDGVAKISDFGIARTSGDPTLTQTGLVTGTPTYFSPALARGAEPEPADDVWALGATLYAAVEGNPPYESRPNPVAILHDITSTQPPRPRRADFLEPALERMLDRDPGSRWSMNDAAHVLGQLAVSHRGDATLESTLVTPAPGPTPGPATASTSPPSSPSTSLSPTSSPPTSASPAASSRPDPQPADQPPPARLIEGSKRSRGRAPYAVLAVLALLVVAAVAVGVWQLGDANDPGDQSGSAPSSVGEKSQEPATEDETSDQSPDQSEKQTEAEAKEQFVRDYFAEAPGGTDAAWEMLGPGLRQQGRESYDSFWRTIESVDVQSAEAGPGDTVEVTLVYRTTDGRTSTERKVETLTGDGEGGYLLESDVPAG
jgi:serine/threonine protein kinase